MAAFSSSSSSYLVAHHQISHDVFVSFRGPDARYGFLSHLLEAFREKGVRIDAFVGERLEKGEEVSPALLKAIEESQISLIIFSKDYASSKWCLDELVKIIECKEQYSQIVIPVFDQIEPSDVRHQTGNYEIPFAEHEKRYDIIRVQNWKAASTKAADLSGFPSSDFKTEVQFIKEIVECVEKILDNGIQKYYKRLVGIPRRIEEVESLLGKSLEEVHIVGIWGPGGIGKTTIAVALFNKLVPKYRSCCFTVTLREELNNKINHIKMQLYSGLLNDNFPEISMTLALPSCVIRRLQQRAALILVDDVYDLEDLKILIHEGKDLFGRGSIIIVTSRDKQVLRYIAGDNIYEVEALNDNEALRLLSLNAFKQENPTEEWFGLLKRTVGYAHGNPLALTVLGSTLFGLQPEEWENLLERLKKMPCKKIQKVLRLNYDRLDCDHKKIFLFLSCFFNKMGSYYTQLSTIKELLDACGFFTLYGLRILEDKALIMISNKANGGSVSLHGLIEEMGQRIVCEEDELGKRSHLWNSNDIHKVLENDTDLVNLKVIALFGSTHLIGLPDLSKPTKLEKINLSCCWSLVEVHESIFSLHQLKRLKSDVHLKSLTHLELDGCESLEDFSVISEQMEYLLLDGTAIVELSSSIKFNKMLERLSLSGCENLRYLPEGLSELRYLWLLVLEDCINLDPSNLPIFFNFSDSLLDGLYLDNCFNLGELPRNVCLSFKHFSGLSNLDLHNCQKLQCISDLPPSITQLYISDCERLQSITGIPTSISFLIANNCKSLKTVTSLASILTGYSALSFRNCINLDECAVNSIMAFVHYKIKQFSYRCQNLEENRSNYGGHVGVLLPGRKVPDWFSHRAGGASITIPLDIFAKSICIGFICCTILSDFQSDEAYPREYRCYVEASDDQNSDSGDGRCFSHGEGFHLVSDHMYLFSHVLQMRAMDEGEMHENRVSLQFKVRDLCLMIGERKPGPMIRECGVHPIYFWEHFNSGELLYLKEHNWIYLTESMESKFNSTLVPTHKTLKVFETRDLKQILETGSSNR